MPIFGEASSPYDEAVEKATLETMTQENWDVMMGICDRVGVEGSKGAKACLISVKKRLNHRDPHVALLALSLLDCLWNNCGSTLQREISSKEFISELSYKATGSVRVVGEKIRCLVKKWAENDCKRDASLSLIESLYKELLDGGYSFDDPSDEKKKQQPSMYSTDPNVVNSEEEEVAIARAIALSLNESTMQQQNGGSRASAGNHYPAVNELVHPTIAHQSLHGKPPSQGVTKPCRVLYDFEAVEENELSLSVGEIVTVLDDSDANWWRGELRGRQGLFPASFVTFELTGEDPRSNNDEQQSIAGEVVEQLPPAQINEEVLLKCIQLLEDCDPTGEVPDPPELAFYEHMSVNQVPLIDQRLAQIDKQLNMLAQVDIAIRDVLASYDDAVQKVQYQIHPGHASPAQPQQPQQGPTTNSAPIQMPPEATVTLPIGPMGLSGQSNDSQASLQQ